MLSRSVQGPFTGDVQSREALHDIMRFVPYNRRTLTALRCVSKPYRSAVQSPSSPWSGHNEVMLSRYGQCLIFNAQEDAEGRSDFTLYSISPIGRKFRTASSNILSRYNALVANGLTKLVLHHAQIESSFFIPLGKLTNLRELELVSCRSITSVSEARRIQSLETLEVGFCPLEPDGVQGLALPHLRRLTIRACHKLSNLNGIPPETVAALEHVQIESCSVYDDTANLFFSNLSPKLRRLELSNTHIDMALICIPEAARSGALETLQLSNTPLQLSTLELIAPSLGSKLEYLSLENCADLGGFEPLAKLERLRFLDVSGTVTITGLQSVANCAALELFRMSNSQIESIVFLSSLTHLRVLDAATSYLTDYNLMFLEGAPQLDTVVLTDCIFVSNINVLRTCPNIRRIFCAKTGVTDDGVAFLTECPLLEELDLRMTSITNVNVLANCPSLKMINVCSTVSSAAGIQALLDKPSVNVMCDSFDGDYDLSYC